MTASVLRDKYLNFFQKRGHKIIPSASLVPENDPTTLFTSSGMQPLIPYLLGQVHPEGKRLCDSQPSFRSQDIEEVGDNRHTTFFEMLGNWSLGDYFKEEQLPWFWELLTKELNLDPKRLFVSVFKGNDQIPKDTISFDIWKKLGVPSNHIYYYGVKNNWWSRSGIPDKMPIGEIGGPDSEVFYEFTQIEHNKKYGNKCHPNCDCDRFMEIGNSVFMEYQKQDNGLLKELSNKNVDFGGGLERLTAAAMDEPDIFQIDLFAPIIKTTEKVFDKKYSETDNQYNIRIIADHVRAATFLSLAGVIPSNKTQGYVMRRLLRRAAVKAKKITPSFSSQQFEAISESVLDIYNGIYFKKDDVKNKVLSDIGLEITKFTDALSKGLKEIEKISIIDGKKAFDLYQNYGFPLEITTEMFAEKGQKINLEEFAKEFAKHRELSRTASMGMFKGGLADSGIETTKLHTATHLLHQALRKTLGDHVSQKGSNITKERLRFDFSHPAKLTNEELIKIEDLINQKIKENLPVTFEVKSLTEAKKEGALAFFSEKYADQVKVYSIGTFSKEVCGGPHVDFTGELKSFKIVKEEGLGAGLRRLYAKVG